MTSTQTWTARAYLWACDRLYNEFAWAYDLTSRAVSLGAWDAWRRSALTEVRGSRVLEIGFGTGALLAALAEDAAMVVGLEPSPTMQRRAARRLARTGTTILRVQAVGQAIPCAEATFDSVVSTFPASYITSAPTLAEIARVLRPGGRLVVAGLWVRPRSTILRALPLFYGAMPPALIDHLKTRLREAGMSAASSEVDVRGDRVGLIVAVKEAKA